MITLAYTLPSSERVLDSFLPLELLEVERNGYLSQLTVPRIARSPAQWQTLVRDVRERELFNLLWQEESAYQKQLSGRSPSFTVPLRTFHVSPRHLLSVWQLLSTTQQLYCRGKQLLIDLFDPAEWRYIGTPFPNGELLIEGELHGRRSSLSFSSCDVVGEGTPPWFIQGITLKLIKGAPSWRRLQSLAEAPLLLDKRSHRSLLQDLEADDELFRLILLEKKEDLSTPSSDTSLSSADPQPYPRLILKDRWGIGADLWMDYGEGRLIPFDDPRPIIRLEGESKGLRRQQETERGWEQDLLETDFVRKAMEGSHYYCPMNKVAKSLTFLLELGWKIYDFQGKEVVRCTGTALSFEEQSHRITITGHLTYQQHRAEISQVIGTFNRREHFFSLSNDTVALIPSDATYDALSHLAEEGTIEGEQLFLRKNHLTLLDPLWQEARRSENLNVLRERLQHFTHIEHAPPSNRFNGILRPYQQKGVDWLAFLYQYGFHGILADEMGLGKTIQVIAFLSRLHSSMPHLIVVPTSLLFNWRHELNRFLPTLSVVVYQGITLPQPLEQYDLILVSYAMLRRHLPTFMSLSYHTLILDESQMIKNADTQTARAVCQLQATFRLCMTGTVIENHLHELWSHFSFLMPDLLGSRNHFDQEMLNAQSDRRHLDRLKKKVAPFFLRRLKGEVAADLPPRIDQVIWIEMSETQRTTYNTLLARFKGGLLKKVAADGVSKHRMEILEALLRLRQVCCHPLLVNALFEHPRPSDSAKFDRLFEDLELLQEAGQKVLIYSQFTSMLHLMRKETQTRGWKYCYLDGSTEDREQMVTCFQEDRETLFFFISLKAGGVGLNLTSADHVYLYDPWWNDAVEEQAISRAHRIGRKEVVTTKRLIVAESIEEKMLTLKERKRLVIDDLLHANENALLTEWTADDLAALFS